MSYSLSVAPEARAALVALNAWIAEETLDEIERVLHDPALIAVRPGESVAVYDFVRIVADTTHYVFLTLALSRSDQRLEVLRIGHVEH